MKPGRRAARLAAAFLASTALLSLQGLAEVVDDGTRNAARSLASQAKEAFAHGKFEEARDLFHRAYSLVPAPTIAVYEGRALVKLNRLVEAEEAYRRALRTSLDAGSPEQFRSAVHDAENELVALRPRMPRVTIVASGPGADDPGLILLLDGEEVKRAVLGVETPADPGAHELTATAPGGQQVKETFALTEKEHRRVEITVPAGTAASTPPVAAEGAPARAPDVAPSARVRAPEAPPPAKSSSPQKTLGFVAGGLGVAGLATGVVTGLMATSRHSDAERQCPGRVCVEGTAGAEALQSFRSLRTVSTIGYVVGGLGLAAGVALLFTAPSERTARAASVAPWVGADVVGVEGAF